MSQIEHSTESFTCEVSTDDNEYHSHYIDRIPMYSLDEYYVDAFLDDPSNKTAAYRQACEKYGKNPTKHDTALANILHKRLASRIQTEMESARLDDTAKARRRALYLMDNAASESVQAQVALKIAGQHYAPEQVKQSIAVEVSRDCVKISTHGQTLTIDNDTYIESESESVETDTDDDDPFLVGTYPVNSHREQ